MTHNRRSEGMSAFRTPSGTVRNGGHGVPFRSSVSLDTERAERPGTPEPPGPPPTPEIWVCNHCLDDQAWGVLDGDVWTCDRCGHRIHVEAM